MADDKTYNGWTNYETWCVSLWIDNEEGDYRYWQGCAQEAWENATAPSVNARLTCREPFTREERAVLALSDQLKEEITESAPDLGASMFSDLLSASLSEVNWHEIASNWMESVEKTEEEEVEEDA
jgi:hypothetical protein